MEETIRSRAVPFPGGRAYCNGAGFASDWSPRGVEFVSLATTGPTTFGPPRARNATLAVALSGSICPSSPLPPHGAAIAWAGMPLASPEARAAETVHIL